MTEGEIEQEPIEELVERICKERSTTREEIWNSLENYKKELRRAGSQSPHNEALEAIADELSVTETVAERIYMHLDRDFG